MNEETNLSENNLEVAEQEETVESTVNDTETAEETVETNNAEEVVQQEEKAEKVKPEQSKEDNAKFASARRKAELEKVREEAYKQGLAQGQVKSYIGKQNPYTGQTINDDFDAQEYLDMYELDRNGKDPIPAYREMQKDKARKEAEEKIKADEKAKQDQWYQDDTKDFVDKYSSEKLQELIKDEDFATFAEGKIGNVPLTQIYENYQKLISKFEKKSVDTAKQLVANNSTTPGAIEETTPQTVDWSNMPKDKFEEMLRKAKDGELK